jgi:hypothetical protein
LISRELLPTLALFGTAVKLSLLPVWLTLPLVLLALAQAGSVSSAQGQLLLKVFRLSVTEGVLLKSRP